MNYPHDRLHTSSENNQLNIFVIACAIIRAGKSIWVGAHLKNPRVYLLKPCKIWYIFRLWFVYIYIVLTLHLKNECSLLFIIGKKTPNYLINYTERIFLCIYVFLPFKWNNFCINYVFFLLLPIIPFFLEQLLYYYNNWNNFFYTEISIKSYGTRRPFTL